MASDEGMRIRDKKTDVRKQGQTEGHCTGGSQNIGRSFQINRLTVCALHGKELYSAREFHEGVQLC